jgi:hypothetical protein
MSKREIGRIYGVGEVTICSISTGETWKHVGNPPGWSNEWGRKYNSLTDECVAEIRRLLNEGQLRQYEIAAKLGVSTSVVSRIKLGKTWSRNPNSPSQERSNAVSAR